MVHPHGDAEHRGRGVEALEPQLTRRLDEQGKSTALGELERPGQLTVPGLVPQLPSPRDDEPAAAATDADQAAAVEVAAQAGILPTDAPIQT